MAIRNNYVYIVYMLIALVLIVVGAKAFVRSRHRENYAHTVKRLPDPYPFESEYKGMICNALMDAARLELTGTIVSEDGFTQRFGPIIIGNAETIKLIQQQIIDGNNLDLKIRDANGFSLIAYESEYNISIIPKRYNSGEIRLKVADNMLFCVDQPFLFSILTDSVLSTSLFNICHSYGETHPQEVMRWGPNDLSPDVELRCKN